MTTSPASPEPNDPLPSLEELIHEARRIARALLHQMGDADKSRSATDIVNSVFGPMLAKDPEILARLAESPQQLVAFINTVIRNKLISRFRARIAERRPKIHPEKRIHDADFYELPSQGLPHFVDRHPGAAIDLADALAWLEKEKPRLAQVVQLHLIQGMTDEEVGKFMGFSTVTAKRDRHDGLGLLRNWLTDPPSSAAE